MTLYESVSNTGRYLRDCFTEYLSDLWRGPVPKEPGLMRVETLRDLSYDPSPDVRTEVARALGMTRRSDAAKRKSVEILREMAHDDNPTVSATARKSLRMYGVMDHELIDDEPAGPV
jgi:hypothetical protein